MTESEKAIAFDQIMQACHEQAPGIRLVLRCSEAEIAKNPFGTLLHAYVRLLSSAKEDYLIAQGPAS